MFHGQKARWYEYRKGRHGKFVPLRVYTKICADFNSEIMRSILEDGFKFYMPYGIGMLDIQRTNKVSFGYDKTKPDGSIMVAKGNVNWVETKKLGHYVFHENQHTNGYNYRFVWSRPGRSFKYKSVYKFHPFHKSKKRLGDILKDPNRSIDYLGTQHGERQEYKKPPINIQMRNGL